MLAVLVPLNSPLSTDWSLLTFGFFVQRLHRIAGLAPKLGPESRVLDVGSGPGALIPHLQVQVPIFPAALKRRLQACVDSFLPAVCCRGIQLMRVCSMLPSEQLHVCRHQLYKHLISQRVGDAILAHHGLSCCQAASWTDPGLLCGT